MVTGTVVRFNEDKGYGFIAPDGGEDDDVFLHANELSVKGMRVRTGTRVEFEVIDGERGLKAYDVRVLGDSPGPVSIAPSLTTVAQGEVPSGGKQLDPSSGPTEDRFEVFTQGEFMQRITELLLESAPQLTGSQINELRVRLLEFGRQNGWVN